MRFKFRAWDKEKNVMMPVKLMDWSEWWVSCNPIGVNEPLAFGERNSFNNEQTDRHILMQFTGIKDKNGKEVYELDILKNSNGLVRVFYEEGLTSFSVEDLNYKMLLMDYRAEFLDEFEVIGNVFEMPDWDF